MKRECNILTLILYSQIMKHRQMNEFQQLYQRIEYLRKNGVKMKEIADCAGMAPSVISSLYTTVLPTYFESLKAKLPDEALDHALTLVNNVSKRRLLANLPDMLSRLDELQPLLQSHPGTNPFLEQLNDEIQQSVLQVENISGLYTSYSLSSSSDYLKQEPFSLSLSEGKDHIRIGRFSAHGEIQWGVGVMGDPQNLYCMFSENPVPPFMLVTIYLQIPFFKRPRQLRGLYIGLDYNRNPVARRIVLIKESESTDLNDFTALPKGLLSKDDLTPEQQACYDYTCQSGDYIKTCTVPSLQMDESDLVKEKRMLAL